MRELCGGIRSAWCQACGETRWRWGPLTRNLQRPQGAGDSAAGLSWSVWGTGGRKQSYGDLSQRLWGAWEARPDLGGELSVGRGGAKCRELDRHSGGPWG